MPRKLHRSAPTDQYPGGSAQADVEQGRGRRQSQSPGRAEREGDETGNRVATTSRYLSHHVLKPPLCKSCLPQMECQVNALGRCAKLGYIPLRVGTSKLHALVDTGASSSVISSAMLCELRDANPGMVSEDNVPTGLKMRVADGAEIPVLRSVVLHFQFSGTAFAEKFLVLPTTQHTILGWPFFADNDMLIDCKRRLVIMQGQSLQLNSLTEQPGENAATYKQNLLTAHSVRVPPYRQESVRCVLQDNAREYKGVTGIVTPYKGQLKSPAKDKYAVAYELVTLDSQGSCQVLLTNMTDTPRTFPRKLEIAHFTVQNADQLENFRPVHPRVAEAMVAAGQAMTYSIEEFQELTAFGGQHDHQPEVLNVMEIVNAEHDQQLAVCEHQLEACNNLVHVEHPRGHQVEVDQVATPGNSDGEIPASVEGLRLRNPSNIVHTELEGQTNEVWFATPENTPDPSILTSTNKRIYDLIVECRRAEELDPTKNAAMRAEFLGKFNWKDSLFTLPQREQIEELLVKYHKIFARHRFDIGGNDEFKVKLTPEHDDPVYKKSPPTSLHIKEDLKVELALLQYYGILRTLPYSKYSSPIFAQRKPNGKMRILVDLRRINHLIRHDYDENNFPVASMEEANAHMAFKIFYSKLDCSQAYHVIKMADERSVQLLSFNFESRTFAYQRLAQGLSRSATAFSSFIRKYLETDIAADRCASFMDDVCTATQTFEQHADALDHVFKSLQSSGLRLTVKKCEFGVPKIEYLGWTISRVGQGAQPEKIEKQLAIMRMPRTSKQVQRMVGFVNYYRNFIPRIAEKLLPFYKLLQKDVPIKITQVHKDMFEQIKVDLTLAMERTLRLPIADRQYVIMADASDFAAGYVLMIEDYTREQGGKSKQIYAPVAFGSKKFSAAQYKHTIHTKEFLAIYYAFETFAHILWGISKKPVIVFTDNKALSSFLQCPNIPAALCKYVDRILQFHFVLTHVAGENNPVADYLSRMYLNPHLLLELEIGAVIPVREVHVRIKPNIQTEEGIPNEDGSPPTPSPPLSPRPRGEDEDEPPMPSINTLELQAELHALSVPDPLQSYDLSSKGAQLDMCKEQDLDSNIREVKMWLRTQAIPETKYANLELQKYHRQLTSLCLGTTGVLCRKFHKHNGRDVVQQTVIPKHLRRELLVRLHHPKTESHRGIRKVTEECRRRFYWPSFQEDIYAFVDNCLTCLQLKSTPEARLRPALQPLTSTTTFPGEMMQIDLIGPFKPAGGFVQVLTAIDVFTKFLFAVPLRRITARTVVDALTTIFLRHSYIPQILLTDKGTQLTSKLMKEVTTLLDIDLKHATVKHPSTIGLLERTHADIKKTLKIYENGRHSDWHKYVDYAVFGHNTSWNPRTRTTPSDLFHGYTPLKAIDARFSINDKERAEFQTTQELQDKLRRLHGIHQQDLVRTYVKYQKHYDKTAHAIPLRVHSYCLLLNPTLDTQQQKMNKMQPKWLGIYRVEQQKTNENYLIRRVGTNHTQLVHRIRLRPYEPQLQVKDLPEIDRAKFVQDPTFPECYLEPAVFDEAWESIRRNPDDPNEVIDPDQPSAAPVARRTRNKTTLLPADPRVVITTGQGRGVPRASTGPPVAGSGPIPMPHVQGIIGREGLRPRASNRVAETVKRTGAQLIKTMVPKPTTHVHQTRTGGRIILQRKRAPEPIIPETPRQPGGQRILPNPLERLGGEPIVIPESPLFREAPIESPTVVTRQNSLDETKDSARPSQMILDQEIAKAEARRALFRSTTKAQVHKNEQPGPSSKSQHDNPVARLGQAIPDLKVTTRTEQLGQETVEKAASAPTTPTEVKEVEQRLPATEGTVPGATVKKKVRLPPSPSTLHKLWSSTITLRNKQQVTPTQKGYTPKMAMGTPKTPAIPMGSNLKAPVTIQGMLTRLAKHKLANPTPKTILRNQPRVSVTRLPAETSKTGQGDGGVRNTGTSTCNGHPSVNKPAVAQMSIPTTQAQHRNVQPELGQMRQGPSRITKTSALKKLKTEKPEYPKLLQKPNGPLSRLRAGVRANRPPQGGVLSYLRELLGESTEQLDTKADDSEEELVTHESDQGEPLLDTIRIETREQKHFLPVESNDSLLVQPEKIYSPATVARAANKRRRKFGVKLAVVGINALAPISETSESPDKITKDMEVQTQLSVPPVPKVYKSSWTEPIPTPRKYTALQFRGGRLPEPGQPLAEDGKFYPEHHDIVVLFSTLERVVKLIGKLPMKKAGTVEGPPQVGDARRMYNKPEKRYTTSLIVTCKQMPLEMANLELALWNLHTQAIGLEAKRIHIPVDQRILRAMQSHEILMAIDRQFLESDYEVHIWHQADAATQKRD